MNLEQKNGIFTSIGKLISTVATDGHRLSKSSLTKDFSGEFDGIIIPKKTVFEISKILEEYGNKSNNELLRQD